MLNTKVWEKACGLARTVVEGVRVDDVDGSIVVSKVREGKDNFGYNALTHEYGDLVKMGVIVPTKVERIALQNAANPGSFSGSSTPAQRWGSTVNVAPSWAWMARLLKSKSILRMVYPP